MENVVPYAYHIQDFVAVEIAQVGVFELQVRQQEITNGVLIAWA